MSRIAERYQPDLFGLGHGWANPATAGYPLVPGYRGEAGGTSAQAAAAIAPSITAAHRAILTLLRTDAPLTADECAARLNRSPLYVRPRMTELRANGFVVPDAARGVNSSGQSAMRWRLAPSAVAT